MKLLHVSQLVRITCASACRKNCGGGGFSKFRLAWRRRQIFSGGGGAAAAGCWLAAAAEFGG